jgi:hypothetical protein
MNDFLGYAVVYAIAGFIIAGAICVFMAILNVVLPVKEMMITGAVLGVCWAAVETAKPK